MADQLYKTELNTDDSRINDIQQNAQLRYIALVFSEQGEIAKAKSIFKALCERTPDSHILRREYASALINAGELDQAEEQYLYSLKLEPKNVEANLQLAEIYQGSARIHKALDCYYRAATLEPNNLRHLQSIANWSNFSDLSDRQSCLHLAKLWNDRIRNQASSTPADQTNLDPTKKITIGFLITTNFPLPIDAFLIPLLANLDRSKFKVASYIDLQNDPGTKQRVAKNSDSCHDSSKVRDSELTNQIAKHGIDVLVDLTGLGDNNRIRVFNKQAAPLQISWLGYPTTTGTPNIKYRISDRVCDPQFSTEDDYSEELCRLPNGLYCFEPPRDAPKIKPRDSHEPITFGAFVSPERISRLTIDLWAKALRATQGSVLRLSHPNFSSQNTRLHITQGFNDYGISDKQLIFGSSLIDAQNLDPYNGLDIALDTAPYNDVNHVLNGLWMGVPVVSFCGDTSASMLSSTILQRLDLRNHAKEDALAFAKFSAELAADKSFRTQFSKTIRSRIRQSALMNHKQFADDFGEVITATWQKLCYDTNRESLLDFDVAVSQAIYDEGEDE